MSIVNMSIVNMSTCQHVNILRCHYVNMSTWQTKHVKSSQQRSNGKRIHLDLVETINTKIRSKI